MKKTICLFLLFSVYNTQAQSPYPCVPDSIIMGFLNSQNSYGTTGSPYIIKLTHLDSKYNVQPKYSFRAACLSPAAKAKIYSLLKGEPYNFEKELDEDKKDFFTIKSINYELKYTLKGDTTRLAEKLDSLYQPMRAEKLKSLQAEKYSNAIVYFIGEIYLYEAIPVLKAGLQDSLFIQKRGREATQLTLAKLGDKYWIDYYCNLYKTPVKEERELGDRLNDAEYINDPKIFKILYETEFKNEALATVNYSDHFETKSIWQWVIQGFVPVSGEMERLQKEKFGRSLYEIKYPISGQGASPKVYTEEVRKGMLEILRACKYDCLVDYSQKPRK